MRRPIQCQGIDRGPQRTAKMGVVGSVQPQFDIGSLLSTIGKTALPLIAGLL